jgi:hypothetical protein
VNECETGHPGAGPVAPAATGEELHMAADRGYREGDVTPRRKLRMLFQGSWCYGAPSLGTGLWLVALALFLPFTGPAAANLSPTTGGRVLSSLLCWVSSPSPWCLTLLPVTWEWVPCHLVTLVKILL